jgi:hypothetical protein
MVSDRPRLTDDSIAILQELFAALPDANLVFAAHFALRFGRAQSWLARRGARDRRAFS